MSPTSRALFNKVFAQSPIRPLQQHMAKAHACAESLLPFFEAVLAEDWDQAASLQASISAQERQADDLKRELRLNLPKGIFMPVPRSDVLELLRRQDNVANKAKDIAGLMLGRQMHIPPSLATRFGHYLQRAVDASTQANQAINELDELLETGFRGNEVTLVESMIQQLDKIEHDNDEMQIVLRRDLFDMEKDLAPVDVMFLYKIIDRIGELADCAQQVGGRLQMLLAR